MIYPKPDRIEYICNGYHRYGKENCTAHRINESDLDELIYDEIRRVSSQAKKNYESVDTEVARWLKSKNTVTGKIKSLKEELRQRKSDQGNCSRSDDTIFN